MYTLLTNQNWLVRGKAAHLLGMRHECGVPEALKVAMNIDQSLCVRREALKSFERVTRYDATDVFAFTKARRWYDQNRAEVSKRLGCTAKDG